MLGKNNGEEKVLPCVLKYYGFEARIFYYKVEVKMDEKVM